MKYLIVGRSLSGTGELCKNLKKKGLAVATIFTTNPEAIDNCVTLTPGEAESTEDKFLHMMKNGHEYFTTKENFLKSDVCLIEPSQIIEAAEAFPDCSMHIIYCHPLSQSERMEQAALRGNDPDEAEKAYEALDKLEDERFAYLDEQLRLDPIDSEIFSQPNVNALYNYEHNLLEQTPVEYAEWLFSRKQMFNNLKLVVQQAIALQILGVTEDGDVELILQSGEVEGRSLENFTDLLLSDKEGFYITLTTWLSHNLNLTGTIEGILQQMNTEEA